jgi:hypothetical protein
MQKLKGHLAYLAGPINPHTDCTSWRVDFCKFLWDLGIGVLNPVDKPLTHSEDDTFQEKLINLRQEGKYDEISNVMREIVTIDLHLVDLSTFIVMYIDKDHHMCGSYVEAAFACLERKPLIIICKQGKSQISPWLFGHAKHELFFNTFDEAKNYIKQIHEGKITDNLNYRWKFLDFSKIFGGSNVRS